MANNGQILQAQLSKASGFERIQASETHADTDSF